MSHRLRQRRALGSTMLLVMILLGVLAALGAAAVTLSSRDRINASAKTRRDLQVACARAAQLMLWAEVNKFGGVGFLSSSTAGLFEIVLPDGTRLSTMHYDGSVATLKATDVIVTLGTDCGAAEGAKDLTNRMGGMMGKCASYSATGLCTIPGGNFGPDRQLEVEFQIRTRM